MNAVRGQRSCMVKDCPHKAAWQRDTHEIGWYVCRNHKTLVGTWRPL